MSRIKTLLLSGALLGGGFAALPVHNANAQEITPDCTYGEYIFQGVCNGPTTRCCQCAANCPHGG